MRARAGLAVAFGALLLAGCGGGSSTGSIEQAIKDSTYSYYAYSDEAWWGRPVTIRTQVLRQGPEDAVATVSVYGGGKEAIVTQTLHLTKSGNVWQIADAETTTAGAQGLYGTIAGTMSTRPATAEEQTAIEAAALRAFPGEGDCLRFVIAVSNVDDAFASVNLVFVGPNRIRCAVSGVALFGREADGTWHLDEIGVNPFTCHHAPAGVLRSLFGKCWIVRPGVGSNG